MAAKKKATKKVVEALSESLEDPTRLPGVEETGADTAGSGSLDANTPISRRTAFETPRTAEDIPALTDKVAETRKKSEASRIREIRSKNKLDLHIERMKRIQTEGTTPMFTVSEAPSVKVMNAKIALSTMSLQDDKPVIAATQKVADMQMKLNAPSRRFVGRKVSHQEIADALNTKSYLKKRVIDPNTGKKVPVEPHTADSVADTLASRAIAQNLRPSSSIEDRLREQHQIVAGDHRGNIMEHLVARSQLDEAKGDLESIQEAAAAAREAAASRDSGEAPREVDAATGLAYGSKNTTARGKSKTDPAVEVIGEDVRKTKQVGFTNADVADLTRAVAPLRSAVLQGGGNITLPTHLRKKDGDVTEMPTERKSPVSVNAIDSMLESVRTSHSALVFGHAQNASAHIRDAHETLLTLKALVPHGTVIRTERGKADFHKVLDSVITAHATAHRGILRRVVQRDKTIKSNLPSLTDVKKRLGSVVTTNKGGRKVFDISDDPGSAVTGRRARKLAEMAGLTEAENVKGENVPKSARRDVIDYAADKGPVPGNRGTSPSERRKQKDIAAYATVGRTLTPKEASEIKTPKKEFGSMPTEDVLVQSPFTEAARQELGRRTSSFKQGNGTA